jgi:acetyltransferase-like isoleucine patch superfamily enzyme
MGSRILRLARQANLDEVGIRLIGAVDYLKDEYYQQLEREYYRRQIQDTAAEVGDDLWVGGKSTVNSRTVIGDNVHFLGLSVRGNGPLTIGDNFHAGSGCEIITAHHNYDNGDAIPYDDTFINEPVEIGDNVWFGINVTVLDGVSIEEGAVIQAGSVVTDDIPRGAIAGGHPATVFGERDMNHYEAMKSAGNFN